MLAGQGECEGKTEEEDVKEAVVTSQYKYKPDAYAAPRHLTHVSHIVLLDNSIGIVCFMCIGICCISPPGQFSMCV